MMPFFWVHISQGSVATRLGYGVIFVYDFVTNFLLSLTVKKIWKSDDSLWSYGQEFGVLFFWLTVYLKLSLFMYDFTLSKLINK